MFEDLVTVIVPLYNCKNILTKNLDSILGQTYKNCEYIFIDDCSKETYNELIPSFENIRLIRNKRNIGVGETRNVGLSVAKGEYIVFFDGDDIPQVSFVEKCLKKMQESNADMVVCNFAENDYKPRHNFLHDTKQLNSSANIVFDDDLKGSVWNKMFRRSIIENFGIRFADTSVANEDICFTYSYLPFCHKVAFINEVLYIYNTELNLITRRKFEDISSLDIFLNSCFFLDKLGKQYKINYGSLLKILCYKFSKLGIRNLIDNEDKRQACLNHILNNTKFIKLCNSIIKYTTNYKEAERYCVAVCNNDTQAMSELLWKK